jgi:DNA-binding response OmpR family regulator
MANHRLLLIEDDFDVAEMLLMYFQTKNYEVMHSDTGKEGIELARTAFPNLILLDVMLPDMDGYEICYTLRNMSLTKYIPTLFLTQKDERASKVKGLELGADDYITKPFDVDELHLRVVNAINRATRENLHETRTGLPTGSLIAEERQKREKEQSTELTFRLHNFKSYGDVYGFMAASETLYHAGKTIRDVLSEMGRNDDFAGILEDDFVVFTTARNTRQLEEKITQNFNKMVSTFYSFADSARGGILQRDTSGKEEFIAMMSLTTGEPHPLSNKTDESAGDSLLEW